MKIFVKVIPNAKEEKILKINNKSYKIYLKEKAEKGKANLRLIKILEKYFNRKVEIISGKFSRKKEILLK